ncbi:MAG TPA: bacteriocin-protection protein, partial [Solibacterales bacterium]|nr:bacteriocin-protection protein [Bryobacterales bacterium]
WRIQTARQAETRARKIEQLIGMLEREEKIHP